MSAAGRRPSNAAALRPSYRAVRSGPAMPVEVMVFRRTGWEDPLDELNERLRALFAVGRAGERELVDMVAAHFGLTHDEMVGTRGTSRVAQVRHIAMYMCGREFGASAGAVGRLFRRDPTSVIHAAHKVAARLAEDPAFAAEVAALAARWRQRCA